MTKTEEVRQLLNEQPTIMPTEAVRVLKDRGVDVTPGFFSTMKTNLRKSSKKSPKKSAKRKTARPFAESAVASAVAPRNGSETLTVSSLLSAKRFVNEVGGIREAKTAVDVLERLL